MTFTYLDELKQYGFEGFATVESLQKGMVTNVPSVKGIYLILYLSENKPVFMEKSIGGQFKGKDPAVDKEILKKKWVDNTIVAYIGQAGGGSSNATLKSRIRQLVEFGSGKPIGHWGGRYLWQIKESTDLVLCWKLTPNSDARTVENELIRNFISHYGVLPFANLKE